MNVTPFMFGICVLDLTIGPADSPSPEPDGASLDGGTTGGYFVGFARHDPPDEAAIHHQCSPYEDDSET